MRITSAAILSERSTYEGHRIGDWIRSVDDDPYFVRITQLNRDFFISLLRDVKKQDSYLSSPTYMTFTGRNGLWVFEHEGVYIPLCLHPNVGGQVLIFPAIGNPSLRAVSALVARLPEPPLGYRLVRLEDSDIEKLGENTDGEDSCGVSYHAVSEYVLDWTYPIRILSTELVASLDGHEFKRIRNRIRHAAELKPRSECLSAKNIDAVRGFVHEWAISRGRTDDQINDFLSPYLSILENFGDTRLRLEGLVFFVDGKVQAFTIWDTPPNGKPIANRFANLCCESCMGLSDLVMQTVAQHLSNKGIGLLNLGGSETKGLDDYKSKFMPTISIKLSSADVVIDTPVGIDLGKSMAAGGKQGVYLFAAKS